MGLSKSRRAGRPWNDELNGFKAIAHYFLMVLARYCPEELPEHVFFEEIFGINERLIGKFRAKEAFKIPGILTESPHIKVQGVGFRKIHRGQVLHVRHDIKKPDQYEVSFFGGRGGPEIWYTLTASEWLSVQKYMEPWDKDHEAHLIRYRDRTLK